MHLLVVLQTHSRGDSQAHLQLQRYCQAPKSEVMRRCVASLVTAMNKANSELPELDIELAVFDDHSDEPSLANLRRILANSQFKCSLHSLDSYGVMPSIMACYRYGLKHGREWIYFAQDDYLHDPQAMTLMVCEARQFSNNLGTPASIYPFNDPYRYLPHNVGEKVHVVRGRDRHWRTNYHTASCFMTHHDLVSRHWDLFERMGQSALSPTIEDDSINQLFISRGLYLFTPIPSLALHLQYESEFDPFMDWRMWWDLYADESDTNTGV